MLDVLVDFSVGEYSLDSSTRLAAVIDSEDTWGGEAEANMLVPQIYQPNVQTRGPLRVTKPLDLLFNNE